MPTNHLPKNGLLSGMIVPGMTAAVVLTLACVSSTFRSYFITPMSPAFQWALLASFVLMGLHKVESYWFDEFDQCPVYLSQDVANPRKAVFLAFVPIFIAMLFFAFMGFFGPPWHLIAITVWLGQGIHELHHTAKSLARGRAYPGLVTSVMFVAVMTFVLFPMWHDAVLGARGLFFYGYYAVLPLVFAGFYFEDRKWISLAPPSVWKPSPSSIGEPIPAPVSR